MKGDLNSEFTKRKEPLCKSSSTPGSPGSTTAGPNHRLPLLKSSKVRLASQALKMGIESVSLGLKDVQLRI